jgi:tetratricopeptide (TPR) repeat protein
MPVARKPGRKTTTARVTSATSLDLPDRRAMESFLAAIGSRQDDDRAQQVMYEAWDQTASRSRIALARKALSISPLCADAYNLLAEEAATAAEAKDLFARGLEAAEMALGPEGFEEYAGHFWGFLETRPYMRARHGLALTLLGLGEEDAAIEHFRAMLELNPGDNQGIRYLLLAALLRRDDIDAIKALLASYAEESSPHWLYTRLLLAYRDGHVTDATTRKLFEDARATNEHVPASLAATRPPALSRSDYITMGGPDEAAEYVRECGAAWKKTEGAIEWLTTGMGRSTKRRTDRSVQ